MRQIERWAANQTYEDQADQHLAQGDIENAGVALRELAKDTDHPYRSFYSQLKTNLLPLYELAFHPTTPERIANANDVYGFIGEHIDNELANRTTKHMYRVGRLSELAIFAILARGLLDEDSTAVPIPASRFEDMVGKIDLHISPVGTRSITDGLSLQTKTVLRPIDAISSRREGIIPIGVNELDEHAREPERYGSLVRCILRELEGKVSLHDTAKITHASSTLLDRIIAPNDKIDRDVQLLRRIGERSILNASLMAHSFDMSQNPPNLT